MRCLFFFLTIANVPGFVGAQRSQVDTVLISKAIGYSIGKYYEIFPTQLRLSNGAHYLESVYNTPEQHPFLISREWLNGSVCYNGDVFNDVPLLYDIKEDKLITESPYYGNLIEVTPELVSWFSVSGRTFQRVQNEMVYRNLPQTGYYEVLYDGSTTILVLRQKRIRELINSQRIVYDFVPRSRYYVLNGDNFYEVKSKKSFLNTFSAYRQPLKKHLRSLGLRHNQNPERVFIELAIHYDLLTKGHP